MELPIGSVLSGKKLEVAQLQDSLISIIYDYACPDAVLYGGTAVWRCYSGGRFSEDIDIHVGSAFVKRMEEILQRYGMRIVWRDDDLPLHIKIASGDPEVLIDANAGRKPESVIAKYERVDGSTSTLYAMSPAELVIRKMEAYESRRYIRDIYDIFHLTNYVRRDDYYVAPKLRSFLNKIEKPVDEKVLPSLIYKGNRKITFDEMVAHIRKWLDEVRK